MYWVVSFFAALFVLCSAQQGTTCDEGYDTCATCFNMLVNKTITSDRNQVNMQNAFFPPQFSPPIYVVVHYFCGKTDTLEQTWFWSAHTFYASFNPLTVHQFTSLFFGDPSYLSSVLNLTLTDECCDILTDKYEETLRLFTQRVRTACISYV